MSQPPEDALLSDLCTICHINPPKYRCPRCQTRTCSLPCTRRHKLWSQCSGVRDPAAYLRRNELATESAFDRDFNFITGVERSMERAERDAENRGVRIERDDHGEEGRKRRKVAPGGLEGNLVKGEAAFLKAAAANGVMVIRAPRGMSRSKANLSRWFAKRKCLNWTVEWILPSSERITRNCLESSSIADAYDRVAPPPEEEADGRVRVQLQGQLQGEESTQVEFESLEPPATSDSADAHAPSQPPQDLQAETTKPEETVQRNPSSTEKIAPHRDIYFYLHRPRTATRQPVLIPLAPSTDLTTALRGHTVLEFPSIYVLPDSPEGLLTKKRSEFLLEEDYLRTEKPVLEQEAGEVLPGQEGLDNSSSANSVDLGQVDEKKVLEVLEQDLFGRDPATATT